MSITDWSHQHGWALMLNMLEGPHWNYCGVIDSGCAGSGQCP
jgi:hypothetical protein